MHEYFHVPVHLRPKVFGMTASPIWNIRDPVGSLAVLEKNLDAKVTAVRDHIQELSKHAPKAEEVRFSLRFVYQILKSTSSS